MFFIVCVIVCDLYYLLHNKLPHRGTIKYFEPELEHRSGMHGIRLYTIIVLCAMIRICLWRDIEVCPQTCKPSMCWDDKYSA